MKKEALKHPKTYDLMARLNVDRPTALGLLTLLWDFTEDSAIQGDIGKWPDGAISRACEWIGEPTVFVTALASAHWIDPHPKFRYVVHDWPDHCQRWVRGKLAKLGLSFLNCYADGSIVATTLATTEATIEPSPTRGTEPNRTEPNRTLRRTEPNRTEPNRTEPFGVASATPCAATAARKARKKPAENRSEDVLAVFAHYRTYHSGTFPAPKSGMKEWVKVRARLSEGYTVADLCAAIDGCHRSPYHCGENEKGKVYQNLELIVRDATHVEDLRATPEHSPVLSEKEMRGQRAGQQWLDRMEEQDAHDATS